MFKNLVRLQGERALAAARDDDNAWTMRRNLASERNALIGTAMGVGEKGDIEMGRGARDIIVRIFARIVEGEHRGGIADTRELIFKAAVNA